MPKVSGSRLETKGRDGLVVYQNSSNDGFSASTDVDSVIYVVGIFLSYLLPYRQTTKRPAETLSSIDSFLVKTGKLILYHSGAPPVAPSKNVWKEPIQ